MTSIGSEFSISYENFCLSEYNIVDYLQDFSVKYYDSGRSAIRSIPKGDGWVLLPEYICDSVIKCFDEEKIVFYKLSYSNLQVDRSDLLSKINEKTDIVYITHYFGSIQKDLDEIKKKAKEVGASLVEDMTQSFFSDYEPIGDYCVASLRKWIQIPDGGVLYTRKGYLTEYDKNIEKCVNSERLYAMLLKEMYLSGTLSDKFINILYRNMFHKCETELDSNRFIRRMSDLSSFLIRCFNVDEIRNKRIENMKYLDVKLKPFGLKKVLSLGENEYPLSYPILVENRDEFRSFMADRGVYCAVHWTFDGFMREERREAENLSNRIISFPIDQRYGIEDMDVICDAVAAYMQTAKGKLWQGLLYSGRITP